MTWGYFGESESKNSSPMNLWLFGNFVIVLRWMSPSPFCCTGCSFMLAFDAEALLFPMAVSVCYSVATCVASKMGWWAEFGRCDHGNHPFWVRSIPMVSKSPQIGDLRWDSKETHQRCHAERCSCQVWTIRLIIPNRVPYTPRINLPIGTV